ncbi:DUF6712 family protein [Emticicia sp.]|uniref:DUF6712 family protein n=1 Tax=Emticicia sp. TaxID=1930953 RepID=UPI0037507E36
MAALIYTLEDLQRFSRSNNSLSIEDIEPFIEDATERYLTPYLSLPFVLTILDGTQTDITVVRLFKQAAINFAMYLYAQDAAVTIGTNGMHEYEDDKGKKRVSEAKFVRYEQNKLKTGHQKLELLLKYLETANTFAVWNTNAATQYKEFLLKSVSDFQKFVNIRESRMVFLACRPGLQLATYSNIIPSISQALYDAIVAAPATAKYKLLIERYIQPALANFALAYSIYDVSALIGVFDTVAVFDNTGSDAGKRYKTAPESFLQKIAEQKQSIGQTFLDQCTNYILSHPNDYTEYPHPTADDVVLFQNDEDSRVYYLGGFA